MVANHPLAPAGKVLAIGLIGFASLMFTACKKSAPAQPASEMQSEGSSASNTAGASNTGSPDKGKQLFAESCASCHGEQAEGIPHLGGDLQTSQFVAHSTDAQVVALIQQGLPSSDPRNKTNVTMPPKGGNPALTTQDEYDIVAFLRQVQKEKGKS